MLAHSFERASFEYIQRDYSDQKDKLWDGLLL